MRRFLAAVLPALLLVGLIASPVRAVDVAWGENAATATYGERIQFSQEATLPAAVKRVEVLLETPGALGAIVVERHTDMAAGRKSFLHVVDLTQAHMLPNTTITARWRVVANDGSTAVGPPVTIRYDDTRFEWQTRQGEVVRVHWYEGNAAFGERALAIGERAVRETAELLGVTEEEPIDFYIYADEPSFREALGPGTRENVGGQANAEIRTLFALIPPAQIDDAWVGIVIPHELTHLVFDTTADNPYHFPPRWLNEGLAVYLSEGFGPEDSAAVDQAVREGSLIPLEGLEGQFPTTRARFFLAYAESVAAVDFFIRQHGQDALIQLVRSYATGLTDDEAFQRAIGMDVAAFDAAWRADLRANEPTEFGPQPAPAGPLPPGWLGVDGSPAPTLRPQPGATAAPAAPLPNPPQVAGTSMLPYVVLGVAIAGVLAIGLFALTRRRSAQQRAQVEQWAAWRAERTAPTPTSTMTVSPTPTPADPAGPAVPPLDTEPVPLVGQVEEPDAGGTRPNPPA